MKNRILMTAGTTSVIAILGVTALIGANSSVPTDFPLADHSQHAQHSQHGPLDAGQDAQSTGSDSGATPSDPPADLSAVDAAVAEAGAVQLSAVAPPQLTSETTAPSTAPGNSAGTGANGPDKATKGEKGDVATKAPHRPAPGGKGGAPGRGVQVTPLPKVPSAGDKPANGNRKGKPQSLGEALAKPHGVAASGVSPAGAGVNKRATKQAPGLRMRTLARGEQDAGVNDAARTGGCAPGYGNGRSCLPVAPPSAAEHAGHGMKIVWTCEELLTLFPEGIPLQVRGTDPLRLDEDGNGIACA